MTDSANEGAKSESGGVSLWLILPSAVFVVSRLAVLFYFPAISSDTKTYCAYAVRGVDLHEVAYADFAIEYPPVSYWAVCLPRLISKNAYSSDELREDALAVLLPDYRFLFRCEMCGVDMLGYCCFLLLVHQLRSGLVTLAAWGYVLTGLMLAPVLYDRLDAGLLLLLMAWAYATARAYESTATISGWDLLASVALGLGVGFKWAPVVMAPYFLLGIFAGKGWLRAAASAVVLLATALAPFLVHMPSAGMDVWRFLEFHSSRATEVESVYASVMMAPLATDREAPVRAVQGVGSWDMEGPLSTRLAQASLVILMTGYVGALLWMWRCRDTLDARAGLLLAGYVLVFTVTFSKVLSPQYFVWLMPLMLALAARCFDHGRYVVFAIVLIVLAVLTTWIFPFHFLQIRHPSTGQVLVPDALLLGFGAARDIQPTPAAILAVRNTLLVAMTVWLGWRLLTRAGEDAAPR